MIRHYLTLCFVAFTIGLSAQTKLTVKIDPRFEAISLFYTLTTADTLDTKPTPSTYYKDVKDWFRPYNLHPSLEWYRKLPEWDGYDIASLGLYLSPTWPFKVVDPIENRYLRSTTIDTFLYHLNKFYADCKVANFIAAHHKEYDKITRYAKDTIARSKILNSVEDFFGKDQKGEFVIYLDLLNNHGNNAIPTTNKKYTGKRFCRLAYLSLDTTLKRTDNSRVVFNPYLNVVAHEAAHIYLRDFLPTYHQQLFKIRSLFLVTAKNDTLAEKEWENEADELMVRACVAKILESRDGEQAGQKEISNQATYYKRITGVYQQLKQYTSNRQTYPTFRQFYPVLVKYFGSLAASPQSFSFKEAF